jgi:hypothetical protein
MCIRDSLILGLAYYVLKDNGVDLLALGKETDTTTESNEDDVDTNTNTNTNTETGSDSTTCKDAGSASCEVNTDNDGWVLFNVPDYKFSVEIPSYGMKQKIGEEEVWSAWKAWHTTNLNGAPSLYSNYLHSVNVNFYPLYIPEGTGCGQGCVDEHVFRVDIYSNEGEKSLTSVKDQIDAKWKTTYDENARITWTSANKWGRNVLKFDVQLIGGSEEGYLVVTKDFVYDITYYMSTTPAESLQVAQKLLDSMKFED